MASNPGPAEGKTPRATDRDEEPPRKRPRARPAFNATLLASPFYCAPTMYGGAGAANSADAAPSSPAFYERRRPAVRVVAAKPDGAMSRTSKRIWDLLAQCSSPIEDARRAPSNARADRPAAPAAASPPPPRRRELRQPSMAALLRLKRNNRTVCSAQAAIAASLSSSLPYDPADYSMRSGDDDGEARRAKMRTKVSGRPRRADDDDGAVLTRLPDAKLDLGGNGPPRIDIDFGQRNGPPEARAPAPLPPLAPAAERPTKRFRFREPLDAADFSISSGPPPEAPRTDSGTAPRGEVPVHSRNGVHDEPDAAPPTKADAPRSAPPPSLADFVARQKSQWECDSCLTRNENSKEKCVCCEAPRATPKATPKVTAAAAPGASPAVAAETPPKTKPTPAGALPSLADLAAEQRKRWECDSCLSRNDASRERCACCEAPRPGAPAGAPAEARQTPAPVSDLSSFVRKQRSQWECACCLTRNDSGRAKCACCEAAAPGSGAPPSSGFDFAPKPNGGFKFGIDKAGPAEKADGATPKAAPSSGFFFGAPPADKKPAGELKFGIPNGVGAAATADGPAGAKPAPPSFSFGSKAPDVEARPSPFTATSVTAASGFSFGTSAPQKKEEKATAPRPDAAPQPKPPEERPAETPDPRPSAIPAPADPTPAPAAIPAPAPAPPAPSSTTASSATEAPKMLFSFGMSSPPNGPSAFGGAVNFKFGTNGPAPAPGAVPNSSGSDLPFKSSMFKFRGKTEGSAAPETKPAPEAASKTFSIPSANGSSLFPVRPATDAVSVGVAPSAPVSSAAPVLADPKEKASATPFSFSAAPVTTAASSGAFAATPAPLFSFGSPAAKPEAPAAPLFGGTGGIVFGDAANSPSIFKTGLGVSGLFGAKPATSAASLFGGAKPAESKPAAPIFGSPSLGQGTTAQSSPFTFGSGPSAFGSPQIAPVGGSSQPSPFGKQLETFEGEASRAAAFDAPALVGSSAAPAPGGIFGSHSSVPTPTFSASAPFGDASQAQPSQGAHFKFSASSLQNQMPAFGRPPGPPPSAGVFAFGSQSPAPVQTQPPPNSFNFSLGVSNAFGAQGGNPNNSTGRRFRKAVRRNPPR